MNPGPGEVMEHLRRGELRDAKPQEISTPQELLEHAKTCKKTLRVWASFLLAWTHFLSFPIRSHEEHQNYVLESNIIDFSFFKCRSPGG